MQVFDVLAVLITCSTVNHCTAQELYTCMQFEVNKMYLNFARRVLCDVKIKVKQLHNHKESCETHASSPSRLGTHHEFASLRF
jgi:hypothetical protein